MIIALLGVVYVVLVAVLLNPRTFFAGDAGVKYLQARTLVDSGWRRLSIANPAARLDPDGRFSVLEVNQFERRAADAPFYGSYSVLFALPVSLCLWAFGMRGLYVVPIVGTLGTLLLTYRLGLRSAPRTAWLAPLLVGAASPFVFYSLDLWEHTLAALCVMGSLMVLLGAGPSAPVRRCIAAGVLLGLGIDLREELYALLVAGLPIMLLIARGRRWPALLATAVGALLALAPHWAVRIATSGLPVRTVIARRFGAGSATAEPMPMPWSVPVTLLAPLAWILPLAAAGALRWLAPRLPRRWRRAALAGIAAVVVWLAVGDALHIVRSWARPDALLAAFPAALVLLLFPPRRDDDRRWREAIVLAGVALAYAAAIGIGAPFGSSTVPIGGSQFGPRFLLPAVPLLAVAVAYAIEQRRRWSGSGMPPGAVWCAAGAAALAGVAIQTHGVRNLRATKAGHERVVLASETVPSGQPIVTDVWWYAMVSAAALSRHETLAVDLPETRTLGDLLAADRFRTVTAMTYVTAAGGPAPEAMQALVAAGWREVSRRPVSFWTTIDFVELARRPAPDRVGERRL